PGTPLRGAVVTGNPVRSELVGLRRLPQAPPLVAFVGGSLGARVLNDAALGVYDRWRGRDDVAVLHVCGARHVEACAARLAAARRCGSRRPTATRRRSTTCCAPCWRTPTVSPRCRAGLSGWHGPTRRSASPTSWRSGRVPDLSWAPGPAAGFDLTARRVVHVM